MTRKAPATCAMLAIVVCISGCFTVPMEAPYGADVRILSPNEPVEVARRYQKWFAIWGIFELSTSNPREVIEREDLVEVRVYTEDGVEDLVSGIFYTILFPAGIILPQTVVVEGNRAPREAD